ncbi:MULTISPECIES: hypothetical protein [unclassified Paenibacillus]|uniref:hypothetical protein n=1 Tax=unclassified Paenibacillus TaxID=185978 RepID=UPI00277FAA83|nr:MULTISPECIES: hypothetical protein [unclassified Paenibacillus]MDQ0901691.1 hypothetical protein [Paenibacillus sp. V4I7]MDQ0919807.1 hypothetical protein [Paenibacillus sp. V4I5]
MPRTTYWVSVGRQEVVPASEGVIRDHYEFEIHADEAELLPLVEQFREINLVDKQLVKRASTPYEAFPEKDQDMKNRAYDERLKDIYFLVYQLGTTETKKHIEAMNLGDLPEYQNINSKPESL